MNFNKFVEETKLLKLIELEKVRLLFFYYHKTELLEEFNKNDIMSWFNSLSLPTPNVSRLINKIRSSKDFIRGKSKSHYKLHALVLDELQATYPGLTSESEEILSDDIIIPLILYSNTRGFIESLAKQINASYEYNIFDGCSVLMRRLLEIMLILCYEHLNIESLIKDSKGDYINLERIINNAEQNRTLNLSNDSKKVLDEFRVLGNLSAHKIFYNCRKTDLKNILRMYRVTIEELLYKSGIKN